MSDSVGRVGNMAPIDINNQEISSITLNGNTDINTVEVNGQEVFSAINTFGGAYAASYLSTTGGTLYTASGGGFLDSTLDGMSNGDALLVEPGSYSITSGDAGDPDGYYHARAKDVLVAGNVDNANNVELNTMVGSRRDAPVVVPSKQSGSNASESTTFAQFAFVRVKPRTPDDGTNYANVVVRWDGEGSDIEVNLVNCIVDKGNANADISWEYNNSGEFKDVRFERCSFVNYPGWQGNYSEGSGTIFVNDTLYENIRNTYSDLSETNIDTNVSFDGANNYNTSNHPDKGHLYVPNTNAIF